MEVGDLVTCRAGRFEMGITSATYATIIAVEGSPLDRDYILAVGRGNAFKFVRKGVQLVRVALAVEAGEGRHPALHVQDDRIAQCLMFEPEANRIYEENDWNAIPGANLDIELPDGFRLVTSILESRRSKVRTGRVDHYRDEPQTDQQFNGPSYGGKYQKTIF